MKIPSIRISLFAAVVLMRSVTSAESVPALGQEETAIQQAEAAVHKAAREEKDRDKAEKKEREKRPLHIETLLVTAERRETFFQETPISIVALGSDDLDQINAEGLESLQSFLPNVSIGGDFIVGDSAPLFMIRGIGQSFGGISLERGVGLYIDDVYYPRTAASLIQFLDIERLEVLRGPQGTLFGRNTTGGAIRYISRAPSDRFEGRIRLSGGNLGRSDVQGVVNVPFSDRVQGRFQFAGYLRDGFVDVDSRDDARGDMEDIVVRGVLRFLPTPRLTVDVGFRKIDTQDFGPPIHIRSLDPNQFQTGAVSARLVAQGEAPLVADDPRFVDGDRFRLDGRCFLGHDVIGLFEDDFDPCDLGREENISTLSLDVRWDVSDSIAFRSLTAVIDGDVSHRTDTVAMGTFLARNIVSQKSSSQEFQLSGQSDRVDWVSGLYLFEESPEAELSLRFLAPNGACCLGTNSLELIRTESLGIFGQATVHLSEKLDFTGGLRYSKDDKRITVSDTAFQGGVPSSAEDSWEALDYRATLQYQFTDVAMGYVTTSKGYKSGGFNNTLIDPMTENNGLIPYDPEEVVSWEAGLRSEWFDRRLRFNLTAFTMRYGDLILQATVFPDSTGALPFLVLGNAGDVDVDGFEMDLAVAVSRRFQLRGSLAQTRQGFRSLRDGSALLIPSTCVDPGRTTFETCDAQDMARAPEWTYSLGARWIHTIWNGGLLRTTATWAFTDELETHNAALNSLRLDSYGLLNVRAQYDDPRGRFSVALFGNNVTDEAYDTTGGTFEQFFGIVESAPGRPREWGLDFAIRF